MSDRPMSPPLSEARQALIYELLDALDCAEGITVETGEDVMHCADHETLEWLVACARLGLTEAQEGSA